MSDLYIDPPIETSPDELAEDAFDQVQEAIPGWVPNDGNLDTIILEAVSQMAAELRDVASAVPRSIFRYFGRSLVGVQPQDATPATALTTWTMINNAGYTIPAGTVVAVPIAGDVLIEFVVDADYVIAPGSTSRADVRVVALTPGANSSGLGSVSLALELIDTLDFVSSVTLNSVTTGGVDAETDDEYLDRLVGQLQLLSAAPILPAEFAAMAANEPGVDRALALDGYNPADSTYNNERMVAVALVDPSGEPVSPSIKSNVDAKLQALREINFIVNVIDPVYTTIDVNVTVNALTGFDLVQVEADVEAALTAYFSPATWGRAEVTGDVATPTDWASVTVVRYNELIALVSGVVGVDYVETLQMRIAAGSFGTADITLPGPAGLTRPGAMNATVNP